MAITHRGTVINLEVLTANNDDIVAKINIDIDSSDDSDPSKYKATSPHGFKVNTTGITSSTSGFVPYESLTESTVLGWISSGISTCEAADLNNREIKKLMREDNPVYVDKALPW